MRLLSRLLLVRMASTTSKYVNDTNISKYLSSFRANDINGIKTSLTEESTYRQLFAQKLDTDNISQSTQPYLNLINVYENEDIWRIRNRYFDNNSGEDNSEESEEGMYVMSLPEEEILEYDDPAICLGIEKFQKNWNLFTESSLFGLDWSNVFAAGGAVLSSLLPIPKEFDISPHKTRKWYHDVSYKDSDIDLFIYGLDEEAAKQKMVEIYETVCNAVPWEVACFRSKSCVTILSQYPYRHIQIVLRLYSSPSEILTGFDVDCSCVGFDGKNVWASPRAHQAIIKQCNVVDLTRRSPSYEMRLAKYADRGFEIKVPSLERSRIDPTIYEKSFEKLHGLARLLVLERLNTPDNRFEYVEKKRERNCRPIRSKSGLYTSRGRRRANNMKRSKFENSDYETIILPYGPKFDAKKIVKLVYKKDMLLNSKWYKNNKQRVLHRHPCFFSTDMKQIFNDCCGYCPVPSNPEEIATQIEEDKIFVRGKMEFIKDDPGRQTIGSFHPLTNDDWTTQAYITNVREDLCNACARGAVDIVENLLKNNSLIADECSQIERLDVEARDYLGRTPLQLAVLGGHTEAVRILLQHNARIIARMPDGKTVVHLASQYGFLDILELLLQKSDENKEKAQEQEYAKSLLEANNQEQSDTSNNVVVDTLEIIDKMEIDQEPSILSKNEEKEEEGKEEEQDDIIDLNVESWDHPLVPLDYAILFGQVEVVKRLVKAGANVRRPIKLKIRYDVHYIPSDKVYFPLGLCLLTQDQKAGLEIATILLESGATASQFDYNFNSILHLAVVNGKIQFIKCLFDMDPKSLGIINSLNYPSLESPLCLAVNSDNLEIAELLIKYGARAYITLEDVQECRNRQKCNKYDDKKSFEMVNQPITRVTHATKNNLVWYRTLIEAGADINYCILYYQSTIRDNVEKSIKNSEALIESYQEELNEKKKSEIETSNDVILQYLNELLEEKKRDEEGSYRGYALNHYTEKEFYSFLYHKDPELFPSRLIHSFRKPYDIEKVSSKEKYTKLLELETKKFNYKKECLEYLIKHDAKTFNEISLENDLKVPKKLMKSYREQLNTVNNLLEEQSVTLAAEEKEHYLKELTLLRQVINKQQEEIDKIYKTYRRLVQPESFNEGKTKQEQDSTLELSLTILSRNTLLSSDEPLININFDEAIMKFEYIDSENVVPTELVPEYVKLFQAVYVNDIDIVERMSHNLALAVQDKFYMTPFMLACLRGHNELAVKILDIIVTQYVPKEDNSADESKSMDAINNYDIVEYSEDNKSLGYQYQEPSQTTSRNLPEDENNKPESVNIKPISNCSVYKFLILRKSFVNTEVVPEEFLKNHKLYQKSYSLNGFEVAVLKNDLETVKRILDWAENYQHVEDNNFEKAGGLVTHLIQGEDRNPMIDSIRFGYVDMMDMLIEYAAGGNNFSIFDIKDPEEEIPVFKIPKYYQGLDVNGSKKRSWIANYDPNYSRYSKKLVEPSYLFYAAYYGNITSIQYFYSERPIKALEKYAKKYINNNSKDLRVTILNTIEDIQKVGRKLFSCELFRNETPFHWAVNRNKHDAVKELARLYKERESKEGDDEEQQLTLEEILDMRGCKRKVTALLLAAQFGYNNCIETLLEAGADPEIMDCNRWSLVHYAAHKDNYETIKLLHKLLQPETYQRMLEQRSKSFNHTPISISILNSNVKLTEYLLQQVTTANLFVSDFENNRYLHLSIRESLWHISEKLIELESTTAAELDERFGFLYHENSFGQTPMEIATQMFLNTLVTDNFVFEKKKKGDQKAEKCIMNTFNLMVPFYLPRNPGNSSSKRVLVEFKTVNNTLCKLAKKISDGLGRYVESKERFFNSRPITSLFKY